LALLIVLAGLGILGALVALFLLLLRRLISVPALIALALLISILPLIPLTCAARPTFIALALLVALVRRSVSLALLPSALATFLGALLLLALLAALATALVGLSWSLAASPLIGLTFLSPASAIFLSFASLSARLPVLRQQHLAARNPGRRREFKSRCCTAGYCDIATAATLASKAARIGVTPRRMFLPSMRPSMLRFRPASLLFNR